MPNRSTGSIGRVGSMPLSIDQADSRRPVEARGVPDELARALDESVEDLKHNRTSDIGDFLERMQRKIDQAMANDAKETR
jgi:hypothetical protein